MNNGITTWIVMVLVFAIGLTLGYVAGSKNITPEVAVEEIQDSVDAVSQSDTNNAGDNAPAATGQSAATASGGATTVSASQLSPGQRQLLETLGVDADSITITPEMIACAEAKVGAARVAEIQNGATPTFMEGASLMACYSS